ncbi:ABC transporter ATP-binding protein [Catellatospora paridis]|uniref:ABC transporter ATP-binding protein n=1 Tax=Catellatospora paridis TaxID=1617086 RepID=UPI0012D3927E|nr:ABC transporter ATP-binding protein [Catellatospora paridis]
MTRELALSVTDVSKRFTLPHERITTVKSLFTGLVKRQSKIVNETQHALQDISFEVERGEFFGIVGRNGSGKSTLLKIMAGIYRPSTGSVVKTGRLVPFIELGVGFNPELTGRENVYLNGAMLGFSAREIEALYSDIVEFAELERFMDQKLKNYSSGMQVRLAFSMATRAKTDILLIDEVLAVGDADFQRKCFDYFKSLKKQNVTVVFVTHDMSAVREHCDRAMLIEDSRIVSIGDTDMITKQYFELFHLPAPALHSDENGAEAEVEAEAEAEAEAQHPQVVEQAEEPAPKRWGSMKAAFTSIDLSSSRVTDADDTISITCTAEAKESVEDAVFGFMIRNASGQPILGTNTEIKGQRPMSLAEGQKVVVRWSVPNVFNEGLHWLEPAIVHNGGGDVCDWWQEAASFTVVRQERTPYIVSPAIDLVIEKGQG